MKVSCVMCHHIGRDLVLRSIRSLQQQKNVELEIIVVTSDKTANFQGTKTIYVQGGPAYKRNIGFRFASHDLIAFFDDDIDATPYSVHEMGKALRDHNVGMVYGKLLNAERRNCFDEAGSFLTSTGFLWARAESGIEDKGQFDKQVQILSGKSAACMIRKSVFAHVGMFDASYEILGEETELSWRVWLSGWKVLYVPSSVTYHYFNTSMKPKSMYTNQRVYRNGSRNYLTMLYTSLGKKRWILPLLIQLTVWTSAAIGMMITGKFEAGLNIFKGISSFFWNIRTTWQKRKHVQTVLRKVSDKELMPIILKNPPLKYYFHRFLRYIRTGLHG